MTTNCSKNVDSSPPSLIARGVNDPRRSGFTLVELLFVVGIVALLAALLFPVFAQVRDKARRENCASNLHQIGIAVMLYAQDSDDILPYGVDAQDKFSDAWTTAYNGKYWPQITSLPLLPSLLYPYISSQQVWRCPSDSGLNSGDAYWTSLKSVPSCYDAYGMSYFYHTLLSMTGQSFGTMAVYETVPPYTEHGPAEISIMADAVGHWHGGDDYDSSRYVVLMADGHVMMLTEEAKQKTERWSLTRP